MQRMSVRRYLMLALVAIGVLPLVLFSSVFFTVLDEHLNDHAEQVTRAMLRSISIMANERAIEGSRRDLPFILLTTAGEDDAARLGSTLRDILSPRREYLALAILDDDGTILAAEPDIGLPVGSAYALRTKGDRLGETAFSGPFDSESLGRVALEASYSNGSRTAVAFIDLEWLSARLFLSLSSRDDAVGIVWLDGRFIASSDPSWMRRGERVDMALLSASAERHREDGREYLVSSESIPGSDWRAVYFRSWDAVTGPLAEFSLRVAMLAVVTLILSAFIAYASWRWISAPLAALVAKIEGIGDGRYDERLTLDVAEEYREIAVTINGMAESIERRDKELTESERRYRLMFERNGLPALLVSAGDGSIRDANPAALAYYGYTLEEMRGFRSYDLDASPTPHGEYDGQTFLATRNRLSSGAVRDVEVFGTPLTIGDEALLYELVLDVTERRIAEERNLAALEEKTLLLREVYHRVKNNLQIISSLLSMQAAITSDDETAGALQEAQDRVFAMSLAHEVVYQMPDISSVDMGDYAGKLVNYLAGEYKVPREWIVEAYDGIKLELERAIPFGLLLGEIATNAFKYGLTDGAGDRRGSIRLSLSRLAPDGREEAELVVEDDGPGLPAGAEDSGSLGLSLIRGLAEQLRGSASWERPAGGGARVVVRFPSSAPSEARRS